MIPARVILSGDEHQAGLLRRFGLVQLDILRQAMRFQGLFQGQRTLIDDSGRIVHCRVTGALSTIEIYVPPESEAVPVEAPADVFRLICWCCCCFAEGEVLKKWGDYGHEGFYEEIEGENPYPEIVTATDLAIWLYVGIRYQVEVCQRQWDPELDDFAHVRKRYVCLASDWSEYETGDKVLVFIRATWGQAPEDQGLLAAAGSAMAESLCLQGRCDGCGFGACEGNYPPFRQQNDDWSRPDGVFLIVPMQVQHVTD
ncbi:MAG: hypothetical protein KKB20_18640 [Proteobacteria bacterium]|nr:hypothetical protein [Pseudomonadota bacterium]